MENKLISIEQEKEIENLKQEIEAGFKNIQIFRSEFLMRNSVLAMNATIDGKYWQALLERNVHFWELMRLKYDFDEKLADIKITKANIALKNYNAQKSINEYKKAILIAENNKHQIQIKRDETALLHMKKEGEQRIREIKAWTKIIRELEPELKYSTENPEEHQAEEWAKIYAHRIEAMKMVGTSGDMNGAMNNILVANQVFKDSKVLKLCDEEKIKLK